LSLKSNLSIVFIIMLTGLSLATEPKVVSPEEILQDQVWKDIYEKSEFDQQKLEQLSRLISTEIRIEVYFAFWCSDSKNNLPIFKKLIDNLKSPFSPEIAYFVVERKPSKDVEFYYQLRQVRRIPTFIVFLGDLEIGRIVENPESSILDDLIKILSSPQEESK